MGCLPSNPINNGMFTIYQLVIRWPIHRKNQKTHRALAGHGFSRNDGPVGEAKMGQYQLDNGDLMGFNGI